MVLVGIDYSISSPGVVWYILNDKFEIIKRDYLGFTSVKKKSNSRIVHFKKANFSDSIHEYLWKRDVVYDTLKREINGLPDYIAFEDYAFQANGKVFNIAEATGALKVKFYSQKIPLRLYDPASIKLFFTGYGKAKKDRMLEEYEKLDSSKKLLGDVNDDIVDAYFICELLYHEILIRKGILNLSELSEEKIRVFNRTTKANPENLLVRDFLQNRINDEN
jgi:Holliday junction resolvasome RuvABC endonuclease subunit